jgi:hypothetical protein
MSGYSRTTSITLQDPDPAELWRLAPTVERILPTIEQFWRYTDRDGVCCISRSWRRLGLPVVR